MKAFALGLLGAALAQVADAQQLTLGGSPAIAGNLLIHSGSFSAAESTVGAGHCPAGDGGARRQSAPVSFDPPFGSPPQVVLSLTKLDVDQGRNARVRAEATQVTRDGMVISVTTWCDTNLYSAQGNYLAIGQQQ